MPDKFDPYREALVMETITIWPAELEPADSRDRERIQQALHADPSKAGDLVYLRTHTGFCRQITVTAADLARVKR